MSASYTSEPASEAALLKFEKKIMTSLPNEYRKYLARHDGGVPNPKFFKYLTAEEEYEMSWVDELWPVVKKPASSSSLFNAYEQYLEYLPSELVCIGTCPGNASLLLAVAGVDRGSIFLKEWDLDEVDTEFNSMHGITKLSNSFCDFNNMLVHDTD